MKEGRKPEYPEKTPGDELQNNHHVTHDTVALLVDDRPDRGIDGPAQVPPQGALQTKAKDDQAV